METETSPDDVVDTSSANAMASAETQTQTPAQTQQNPDILIREIAISSAGQRLDKALAETFTEYSRAKLQKWFQDGDLTVANSLGEPITRQRDKVQGGEVITIDLQNIELEVDDSILPEDIPLTIVYEDDALLIVNKPAGLVVHPGAGNRTGTLQNGLLHYDKSLAAVPRAGIVHRLDKDTTGLMIVARTLESHTALVRLLKDREIEREYEAIVRGLVTAGGTIDLPMGRHPRDRMKMAVLPETSINARSAVTHYRVLGKFAAHTHLQLKLETGRTHQIRVHLTEKRHPIVGDPMYGGRFAPPKGSSSELRDVLNNFSRQALHARRLAFVHPSTGEAMEWHAPRPDDMEALLLALRNF